MNIDGQYELLQVTLGLYLLNIYQFVFLSCICLSSEHNNITCIFKKSVNINYNFAFNFIKKFAFPFLTLDKNVICVCYTSVVQSFLGRVLLLTPVFSIVFPLSHKVKPVFHLTGGKKSCINIYLIWRCWGNKCRFPNWWDKKCLNFHEFTSSLVFGSGPHSNWHIAAFLYRRSPWNMQEKQVATCPGITMLCQFPFLFCEKKTIHQTPTFLLKPVFSFAWNFTNSLFSLPNRKSYPSGRTGKKKNH